jgi:dephospho-CoA kinase
VSKWTGKYVIGVTGNIGTGKSVVRKMLEHLGAYGIDADALGHRAIARGAPGYEPIIQTFGKWVLGPDEQIDRGKLGRIVFSNPETLPLLEKIVHPLVVQAIDLMVRRASQPVIIIEAIKLIEANLSKECDSVWVTYAPPEIQFSRLVHNRHMTESEARQRMASQPSQEKKMVLADIIIKNAGSYEDTWKQVVATWQRIIPAVQNAPVSPIVSTTPSVKGEITILRGKPRNSGEIARFINRIQKSSRPLNQDDIMAAFGEKAYLLLQLGQSILGVIGWQVENLVSRTTDIIIDPSIPSDQAIPELINQMEKASKNLQCEASLVFVPQELSKIGSLWQTLGYEQRKIETLGNLAWQEAALESMPPETTLYFKQLRVDRILRPI